MPACSRHASGGTRPGKNWATYLTYTVKEPGCAGDYDFSMWARNSYGTNPAELLVTANEAEAVTFLLPEGPTSTADWHEITATLVSDGTCTMRIEIRDLTQEYSGDDYVLDDISLVPAS